MPVLKWKSGKPGLVELFGASSTSERKAVVGLRNYFNANRVIENKPFCVEGFIDEQKGTFKIDTGSDVSIMIDVASKDTSRRQRKDSLFN